MKTLNINQAAEFLRAHKETVRRMAACGSLPAVKIGRSWVFIEEDLVMYMRSKYSCVDASQGVERSSNEWHSTKEMVSGGSIFSIREKEYEKVLGLK